ncbi:pirin family protein [Alkalimarinus coralli]|uniref:pirin family protein n=1 Tax=Alkalimarinus coralli TaxID=2935863 RepID=UPI00202ACEE5|nr:pirin family protein [Alkalimarinus coralli]
MSNRTVLEVIPARPTSDGDGVKISRVIGNRGMKDLDPFLLLDEIKSDESKDYIGGFPPHPHRGFETITYMRNGSFRHRDHLGNDGVINSGGAQWMTAGSGVIHSEMPEQEEGSLHGFQVWLNLPAKDKMQKASYRNIQRELIPEVSTENGVVINVLAGNLTIGNNTYQGPIHGQATQPVYWDLNIPQKETLTVPLDERFNGYLYLYSGTISIENREVSAQSFIRLSEGCDITITANTDARLLLLAGIPIGEPIANHGPFVMNNVEEIRQAMRDYEEGTLTDEEHVA